MSHDQTKPKDRCVCETEKPDRCAENCGCFHCRNPTERSKTRKSGANQQTAQRESFGKFMNAKSQEHGPIRGRSNLKFPADTECNTIGRAMNRQGYNQCAGDLAKAACRILIEMTGCACRANVVDILADQEKKGVTAYDRNGHHPPSVCAKAFRHDGKKRDDEQSAGGKTNQSAEQLVR